MRWLAALLLAVGCVAIGSRQVPYWTSNATLWRHAMQLAPAKERPVVNVAKGLFATGHAAEARRLLAAQAAIESRP